MKTILKISAALFLLAAFGVGCGSSNNNGTCVAGQTMINNVCTTTLGAGLVNGQCLPPSQEFNGYGGMMICCPQGFNPNSYPQTTVQATCPQVTGGGYGGQYGCQAPNYIGPNGQCI